MQVSTLSKLVKRPVRACRRRLRERSWAGYQVGPVLANQLGLQVVRLLGRSLAEKVRPHRAAAAGSAPLQVLLRDGVVVLPDFFAPDVFAAIRREFEEASRLGMFEVGRFEEVDLVEEKAVIPDSETRFPTIRSELTENESIDGVISGALGHPLRAKPWTILWTCSATDEPPEAEFLYGTNYLHADVHYSTYKCFLYLADVSEENGAFMYARGSHRLSWARLRHEYDTSVRVARAKRTRGLRRHEPYGRLHTPTEDRLRDMGVRPESICGKANTVVLANTSGSHRRGDFSAGSRRELVVLDFRPV